MIHGVTSSQKYVYHYTRAGVARDFILKNGTIQLGRLASTNDPREAKDWEFDLWTDGACDLGKYRMAELSSWFSRALKQCVRLACFSMDREPFTGDPVGDILHRGFAKPRMWAQYSENHTGVCLVFDRVALVEALRQSLGSNIALVGPVTYRDHYGVRDLVWHEYAINVDRLEALGMASYVGHHIERFHDALFFEKLADWRDETEWRILALSGQDEPLYIPYGDSLVGIMHGASIDRLVSDELLKMTDDARVEHMGLRWKNSNPWYDFGSFRWSAKDRASPWARHERGA